MAGFRGDEYAMTRALLDYAGGQEIRVLPCTQDMLQGTVGQAIHSEEVDWTLPPPKDWIQGGGYGSQRTILFSGRSLEFRF